MYSLNRMSIGIIIAAACLFTVYAVYSSCCSMTAKLDHYVQMYADQGLFSGAVLVAKDGKILLCKAYGMANLEHDIPNKIDTKFKIASMTKSFTAMAIMQLQEMGKLAVQDSLAKYIPDYPRGKEITIHQLLTHTSGVPHHAAGQYDKQEKIQQYTLETRIALFKNKPLDFNPGEKFGYSDYGYILLTYIIEKASGETYEQFLKEYIFDPLSMQNTGYDDYKRIIKNRASGYTLFGTNADYIDMSFLSGAGALYSTVQDLYRWDQALYTDKLISKKSLDTMFTPFKDNTGYGWGVLSADGPQGKILGYAGQTEGFTSFITRYIDHKVCIIILSNFQEAPVGIITKNLGDIVFGEKPGYIPKRRVAIVLKPEIYDQYIGIYKPSGKATTFLITKEQDKLFVQIIGQEKCEIYPEAENEFFYKYVDVQISFVKDATGKVTKFILHQEGQDLVAEKVR